MFTRLKMIIETLLMSMLSAIALHRGWETVTDEDYPPVQDTHPKIRGYEITGIWMDECTEVEDTVERARR